MPPTLTALMVAGFTLTARRAKSSAFNGSHGFFDFLDFGLLERPGIEMLNFKAGKLRSQLNKVNAYIYRTINGGLRRGGSLLRDI